MQGERVLWWAASRFAKPSRAGCGAATLGRTRTGRRYDREGRRSGVGQITVQQTAPPREGARGRGVPSLERGPSEAQPRQRPGAGPKRSCEAAGTAVSAAEPMPVAGYSAGCGGYAPIRTSQKVARVTFCEVRSDQRASIAVAELRCERSVAALSVERLFVPRRE